MKQLNAKQRLERALDTLTEAAEHAIVIGQEHMDSDFFTFSHGDVQVLFEGCATMLVLEENDVVRRRRRSPAVLQSVMKTARAILQDHFYTFIIFALWWDDGWEPAVDWEALWVEETREKVKDTMVSFRKMLEASGERTPE